MARAPARPRGGARKRTPPARPSSTRDIGGSDWVDAGFALVLTLICLAGWSATFAGSAWWIAGAAAAAVGCLSAVTVAATGATTPVTALAVFVLALLGAGPLATGEVVLRGLAFLESGISGAWRSWGLVLGTYPPITAEGDVLLAPVLLSLACAGLATGFALAGPRAGLPLVAPVATLVLVLLMARQPTASLLVQGSLFGAVSLAWVFLRGARLERPTTRARATSRGRATDTDAVSRRRLATGLVLIVLATAATTLASTGGTGGIGRAVDPERVQLRDRVDGYDSSSTDTPLDDFRLYTRQPRSTTRNLYDADLLEVLGLPAGTRLRFSALDEYDGESWTAGNETDPTTPDDRFLRLTDAIDPPTDTTGRERTATVRVGEEWDSPWVPLAGDVTGFELTRESDGVRRTTLRYNPASGTAVMLDQLSERDGYRFTTRLGDDSLNRAMLPSPYYSRENYRQAAFLDEALVAWSTGATTAIDALLRAGSRLRTIGRYTDGAQPWEQAYTAGQDRERLGEEFALGVPTAGNDEQYAAVMALFASRLRIPARVVVGSVLRRSGRVTGKDVAAWVEVRIEDGTWRVLPTESFLATKPVERTDTGDKPVRRDFPVLESLPNDPQIQPPTFPTVQPPLDPEQDPADASEQGGGTGWWVWLLLAVMLLVAAVPSAKAWRRRRRRRPPRVSAQYAGAWAELVDLARDLGYAVPPDVTRPAQARELVGAASGPLLARGPVPLTSEPWTPLPLAHRADAAVFGGEEPDLAAATAYWKDVDQQRSVLAASRPPWRRALAWFDPRSLLPGR